MKLTPERSRLFWRTLMENCVALIEDADVLLSKGSAGRARSLLVLAHEELARASALYDTVQQSWTSGLGDVELHPKHTAISKMHLAKIKVGDQFSSRLGPFWGDYEDLPEPREPAAVDKLKQAGFYVERSPGIGGRFGSPLDVEREEVETMLIKTALTAEMALISDHSRMKLFSARPYDSTHDLQNALLPIAHPKEFADFVAFMDSGGQSNDEDEQDQA